MSGTVFVPGVPAPQGSAKAYVLGARAVVTHANKHTMPWRSQVAAFVRQEVGAGIAYPTGPVCVRFAFVMPRRAAEPKRMTPPHTRKPDIDKLVRACLDAMTGIVFTDDAQVTCQEAVKNTAQIGEQPGVHIQWSVDE